MKIGSGQKLYQEAKIIIPGGNQLLSKRPEMFLPNNWPSYYKKAKGCKVWDLDDNRYIDMSIMGIGTCSLGYANPEVNKAVKTAIENGSFSTLNSHEEVELAEKLIDLHPHMDMVRFARTGGEANALAVRIARAASGKSKVAVCGYHGWHDWYLAANLKGKNNLSGLLLPGLEPAGVPPELKGTTLPFHYDNIAELETLTDEHDDIGAICIEVQRGKEADLQFLKAVRMIANKINAVLIFDEISSGFRLTVGGLYKLYDLEPDIVVLGKALGNGYGISAVLGKRNVMEAAQSSFISSSYWTERTGYAAALETIRQFESKNAINHLTELGDYFRLRMSNIFKKIDIKIDGMLTVPILVFEGPETLTAKTFFTQEMLKRGFLASNVIYLSLAHTEEVIDNYALAVKDIINQFQKQINDGSISKMLDGPICHSGFQRLT
jgi:glutamate-1-semialdehyde 2,1-aminomutase